MNQQILNAFKEFAFARFAATSKLCSGNGQLLELYFHPGQFHPPPFGQYFGRFQSSFLFTHYPLGSCIALDIHPHLSWEFAELFFPRAKVFRSRFFSASQFASQRWLDQTDRKSYFKPQRSVRCGVAVSRVLSTCERAVGVAMIFNHLVV